MLASESGLRHNLQANEKLVFFDWVQSEFPAINQQNQARNAGLTAGWQQAATSARYP